MHCTAPKGTENYYKTWTMATSYKPVTEYNLNYYKESDRGRLNIHYSNDTMY
jgi:hypothetical protein